ncbi:MAG: S24 family peptidase [Terriglobales bacterium]
MKFRMLQENLRKSLWERIDTRELTGLRLAEQTGFKQAHISNFLNRKRGLSLEGMDRVLNVQHLSVLDLIDPAEVNKRASILPPSEDEFENVIVADAHVAASERLLMGMHVKEILKFKKSLLKRLKQDVEGDRSGWERFVVIKVDAQEGMSMYPRIMPSATLLLDRHYNSLTPYRRGESNMYAVRKNETCVIRYIEALDNLLILRPHNQAYAIEVITLGDGQRCGDHIVGRVCYVWSET